MSVLLHLKRMTAAQLESVVALVRLLWRSQVRIVSVDILLGVYASA